MILSLSSVRTHAAPGEFFPGTDAFSTPMFPFRPCSLNGSGNGKPETMSGGGGAEIGAKGAADMDSRPGNFFAMGAVVMGCQPRLTAQSLPSVSGGLAVLGRSRSSSGVTITLSKPAIGGSLLSWRMGLPSLKAMTRKIPALPGPDGINSVKG